MLCFIWSNHSSWFLVMIFLNHLTVLLLCSCKNIFLFCWISVQIFIFCSLYSTCEHLLCPLYSTCEHILCSLYSTSKHTLCSLYSTCEHIWLFTTFHLLISLMIPVSIITSRKRCSFMLFIAVFKIFFCENLCSQ